MTNTFQLNQIVYDKRYPTKIGTIVKITKSSVHVKFESNTEIYDKQHQQFLIIV